MKINKKEGRFLKGIISHWEAEKVITPQLSQKLTNSYEIRPFDWKKLSRYSLWTAVICGIIAFGSVLSDGRITELIFHIFSSSYLLLSGVFTLISAALYYLALQRRKTNPEKIYSNEVLFLLGIAATATAIIYLTLALDLETRLYPNLFLVFTIIYGALALWFPSRLIWVFAMFSLGSWFGAESGYISGWGAYFLGMNFPLRFVLFGMVLIAISFVFRSVDKLSLFHGTTYIFGLLYFFIALWILSIFGNYGDMSTWHNASTAELLGWGALFGLAAATAIVFGLKFDDYAARSFGITFLFLNLYTKFFEFFWNDLHKAVFFLILAFSFWLIGTKAEKIWNLEFLKKTESKSNES